MSTPFEDGVVHASDCAVHRSPAYPAGECDCQPEQPALDAESTLEMYRNACARLELQNKMLREVVAELLDEHYPASCYTAETIEYEMEQGNMAMPMVKRAYAALLEKNT